jgi:hypothetical protein
LLIDFGKEIVPRPNAPILELENVDVRHPVFPLTELDRL